jgi:N-acetylglucosamine-6-sulfatase
LVVSGTLWLITFASLINAGEQPNVVVILIDDLRWDELGCTGHPFARTPGIDRVANEGARFRNAFCTTPLCSPSRANLLTGQYTFRHGILDNTNRSEQSHQLITFPKILNEHGYRTAFVGKWHMGNDGSPRPGFDAWFGINGQGTSFNPVLNENGAEANYEGHTTDVLNRKAVEFLTSSHNSPFCLYVAHKALHPETIQRDDGSLTDPGASRFLPALRHADWYASDPIPRRPNVLDNLSGKPALQREIEGLPPLSIKTGTDDETIRDRQRMLAGIDEGVVMIFDALEKIGQLDETIVIVTSDHGYWYGEHGLSVERRLAYEESIRIPLLIRYPRLISPGRVIDPAVLTIDLAPSTLELCGVESSHDFDGMSFVRLMQGGPAIPWRNSFLIEYYSDTVFPRMLNMGYQAIRTDRWKFIHYRDLEGMDELYDLQVDPYEMDNIIDAASSLPVLETLKAELSTFQPPR